MFGQDICQIKKEYARLVYDGQLIQALSKKMADEEQEIDALRTSNLQAKKNMAAIVRTSFFDTRSSLEQLNDEECSLLLDAVTSYPDLLKGSEEDLITCLYLMTALSPEVSFLKVAKSILMNDTVVTFYARTQNQFVKLHVLDTWKALIYFNLATKEDHGTFKQKAENKKRGM